MICPNCGAEDFTDSKGCSRCRYPENAADRTPGVRPVVVHKHKEARHSGNLFFDFAQEQGPQPLSADWRTELKRKLAEVQEKRGRSVQHGSPLQPQTPLAAAPPALAPLPGIRRASVDPQPAAKPDYDIHKNLRDFQAAIRNAAPARSHGSPASPPKMTPVQKELPKGPPLRPSAPMAVTPGPAAVETERLSWIAAKSILLTRTLSGLIDMLAVAGCSALFLGVSVGFGRIDVLSPTFRPALWGAVLFLQAFYSTYFLLLAGRTPGMMLTGLKVVNEQNGKARAREVILRSLLFFVSCAPLMLGLLWGIWDRRSRCMHDALSHTRVVRC